MVLYFTYSFPTSIWKGINLLFLSLSTSLNLNVLTYVLILGNIKANGFCNFNLIISNQILTFSSSFN